MGYFDYLEEKVDTQKEFRVYDYLSKYSFWFSMGTLLIFVVSVIMYLFVEVGKTFWTGLCPLVGVALSITGIIFAQKAWSVLHKNRIKHPFNSMSRALNILFGFLCLIIFAINLFLWI